jgi:tetratricopeptide (TPR) repeat protein
MRDLYWAYRFFALMIGGIVVAVTTGNPLYLLITVGAFIGLAFYVWRQGYVYEPKWEPLVAQAEAEAINGDWPAALTKFQTAIKKCRNPTERRQASEQIGTYLLSHNRIGEGEPYLRQAVNLTNAALGPTHAKTAALRDQLSDLYVKTGQAGLAAQLQGNAVSQGATAAVARYAEILQQSGDVTAAAAQYQKALQAIDATKADTPALIPVLLSASRYATGAGDLDRAEALLRRASRCIDQRTQRQTLDDVLGALTDVLAARERYADAIKVAQERLKGPAPEAAEGARIRRQLADLMEKAGMTEDAAKQRRLAGTLEAMATPRKMA